MLKGHKLKLYSAFLVNYVLDDKRQKAWYYQMHWQIYLCKPDDIGMLLEFLVYAHT